MSKDLQDYKVKIVLETEMLQGSVWRKGLQDYKNLSGGRERERAILDLSFESKLELRI